MPTKCKKPLPLKISRLCHVTHKEQAQIIRQTNFFKPHRKVGKCIDGCNPGRSYRIRPSDMEFDEQATGGVKKTYKYDHISTHEEMFPGFYSWWGLYVEKPIPGLQGYDSEKLPNYLKDPPCSIYGNTAFIISFDKILESYASSRRCHLHDLRLRVGGTMRYKREIAYVIIVCTCTDKIFCYDLITSSNVPDLLGMEGFIDDKGRIKDIRHFPSFTTCYYDTYESHEALNFAFYFPEEQKFTCRFDKIEDIKHPCHGCIHKVQMKKFYYRESDTFDYCISCPNDEENQQRQERVLEFAYNYDFF